FESVARHGSCTRAADELGVSTAAVSQQIKLLENLLGCELFKRHDRKFILTNAGEACLPELRKSFDHLINAIGQVNARKFRRRFNLSSPPSLAARWLIPHFNELVEGLEECDIWVSTSLVPFHLDDTNIDLAIIHGSGKFFNQQSTLLMPSLEVPVCAPSLLQHHPLDRPADLRHHCLVHEMAEVDDTAVPSWKKWLEDRDIRDVDHETGPRFSNPNLVVEAALAGAGVALARGALVTRELASGQLLSPFGRPEPGHAGYYLVRNPTSEHQDLADVLGERIKHLVARSGFAG
ncbi:LysR family transcriptional regulator, partial [Bordetella pseudohinzii]